ncbi:MAG: aminomethyl-transferring glycine dehydrogenase [SAR324 cluster bacterium]|nr:aminomethyl-transferring glycine dehydrogenase [SAR324 cluster bacterium]MBL7034963.1 aminomethyl-transferring glycine dehydrogenase [SAR324 cluster bacterium]
MSSIFSASKKSQSNNPGSLCVLEQRDRFVHRHIGPSENDISGMLESLGMSSLDELINKVVPDSIRMSGELDLSGSRTETEVLAELRNIANRNQLAQSMIGMGYHNTIMPGVIQRNLLENPGWYTAYTPYQPEVSQGRLEALLNYQQMIIDLTGMDVANASLLDEATAAAEAMTFCKRITRSKSMRFFVANDCHPQIIDVLKTRAEPLGFELVCGNLLEQFEKPEVDLFGALIQYPGTYGKIHDIEKLIENWHESGTLVTVASDPLSLVLLKPPGELGADVVIGSSQRFGVPMGFGGPHAAFFAAREKNMRSIPGRIIGASIDRRGKTALRMALQTREQHIRREKATSNICTAQVLLGVIAGCYAVYHGPDGLKIIARRVHRLTRILQAGLTQLGITVDNENFFDTLTLSVAEKRNSFYQSALENGINLRKIGSDKLGISLDETTSREDVAALWSVFAADNKLPSVEELDLQIADDSSDNGIPQKLRRNSKILTHPVFHQYHSETAMLRYLRYLQDKDIALDRAMIPLGSCTMKLNATAEMIPISWPEFANIHPFAPSEQTEGYREMITDLENDLARITGFDAVSMQPNSGAQGEYTGLLTIRSYHKSRGEGQRNVCLIPSSAHGTNPASAMMASMKIVIIKCDHDGNIDVDNLQELAEKHADNLAALMITYPSTHGVFEDSLIRICEIIHNYGGQVYMDGANLNALMGIAQPGKLGPDVLHMNLHKTFSIPHGGGGPGMGPIGLKTHLAQFAPNHSVVKIEGLPLENTAVSAAPWGSPSILPISWVYIKLMGGFGLKKSSQVAILNANYLAQRLKEHFPIVYTGKNGLVAHECIIDVRPLKELCGITEEDIAKRLIDYGFHAPTMSWPVPGTLMIEPTESEPKAEIDRFCEAMISIREETKRVESGEWDKIDNPLKNSPHPSEDLTDSEWTHPYSQAAAVYPLASLRRHKYWPPSARVDNVHGDRNVVCSCPPLENYEDGE